MSERKKQQERTWLGPGKRARTARQGRKPVVGVVGAVVVEHRQGRRLALVEHRILGNKGRQEVGRALLQGW
jgi:hypothetical protein